MIEIILPSATGATQFNSRSDAVRSVLKPSHKQGGMEEILTYNLNYKI